MFGLMRTRIAVQPVEARESRRLAYCGTCKTLGSRYGQRTRALLSHDAVFLAEILRGLWPGPAEADPALRSYNCLARPRNAELLPLPLRFAAAANLLLAEGQLADRREDRPSRAAEAAARLLAEPFRRAAADLEDWGVPVLRVKELLATQSWRERTPQGSRTTEAYLHDLAEPTAEGSALVFGAGARAVGRPDASPSLEALGRAFGNLIYLLDAFEDEGRDAERGEFNAFRAAYGLGSTPLDEARRTDLRRVVRTAGVAVAARIADLPISASSGDGFEQRLWSNLAARLGEAQACDCASRAIPLRQLLGRGWERSREILRSTLPGSPSWLRALVLPPALLLALPLALFLPAWIPGGKGLGDLLGLTLNLMYAGEAARILLRPLRFSAEGPGDTTGLAGAAAEAAGEHVKKKGGGGCCDSCDCRDSCDCSGCDCGGCDC